MDEKIFIRMAVQVHPGTYTIMEKIFKDNSIIYKKPTIYSKPIAKLELGRLVLIKKCKPKWCKIKTGKYIGWIFKDSLWGKI